MKNTTDTNPPHTTAAPGSVQDVALVAAWAVVDEKPTDILALVAAYPYHLTATHPTAMEAAVTVIVDSILERRFFATQNNQLQPPKVG